MRPERTRVISAAPGTPSVPLKFGRLKAPVAAGQRKLPPRARCCWPAFLGFQELTLGDGFPLDREFERVGTVGSSASQGQGGCVGA